MSVSIRQQRTIRRAVVAEGFGYWSGRDVCVEFRPAMQNTGIVFVRHDLNPAVRIPALVSNRVEMPRRTSLVCDGAQVEMVEHILAALAGLRIDNCEVWVDQPEMPGCDGSSGAFVDALDSAGVQELSANRQQLIIRQTIRRGDRDSWVEASPPTSDTFSSKPEESVTSEASVLSLSFQLDYSEHPAIGRQSFSVDINEQTFRSELARSRTFLLEQEAQWLRKQGFATRATTSDALVFAEDGPIDNPLRFTDECVRHKTLDLIGDLALAGCDIVGHVRAHCSGHRLNAELVKALVSECERTLPWRQCA